jgi:tetratricopeptide (TPR) repeat protein
MRARLQTLREILKRRSVRLGLVALVLVGAGVAYHLHRERAIDRHRELADAALDRLDLPVAAEHLRAYTAERPDAAEAHFLLARTLRRDARYDAAVHHLNEAQRLGWDPDELRRESFLFNLQRTGIRDRPDSDLLALVRGRAPDRAVLEALFRGDLALKNWDRAGLWLHLWLEHHPDDWAPRLWQAELLERFKKYDRARADYLRVLQLRPDQPRALLGVGTCALANRADYAEAEEYLNRYLEHDRDHADARVGLARCRYGRGDLAGARERVTAVLESNPRHPGAALLLGTIEAEAGHDAEALGWVRVAEAGGADPMIVNYQLAQLLPRLGRTAEAEEALRRFTERRELLRAAETATRLAEQEPNSAERQYEVGRLNVLLGEEEFAKQWFAQALEKDPNHRATHSALADYYARQPDAGAAARAKFHRERARTGK